MSSSFDLIIKNGKCFIDGQLKKVDIGISNEIVKKIGNIETSNQKVLDATNLTILPGIIDTQVHFREPGSTDVEDLESGSKAAVLGGITSVFEMPNTKPNTTTIDALNNKYNIASKNSIANYSFMFGGTNDNLDEILKIDSKNVAALKLFLGSSTGNMLVDNPEVLEKIFTSVGSFEVRERPRHVE